MQKKLIALAVAGLVAAPVAMAQSNVTIYGILDIGYVGTDGDVKADGVKTSAKTTNTGAMSALSTSRLGFRGTEDLGNGLKAHFNYELRINDVSGAEAADAGNSFATRQANLGLSGGFGSVTLGRQTALSEITWGIGSAGMSNNVQGALYTSGLKQDGTRYSSVITYATPNYSGFTAAVQYGKTTQEGKVAGITVADEEFEVASFNVKYSNGPLNISGGYSQRENQEFDLFDQVQDTTRDAETWMIGANYDFKVVKVFGLYVDGENKLNRARGFDSTTDVGGFELGVHVPVTSQLTLLASYFDGEEKGKTAGNERFDADIDGFQLGALYSLSKRTTAYALYGDTDIDYKEGADGFDADSQSVAIGIRHSF